MNTMGVTDCQQAVPDFIRDFRPDKGVIPSLREIQGYFEITSSHAAHKEFHALKKKGAIQNSEGAARSMTVTGMLPVNLVQIPLLGMIPAGYPSDQEQQSERCVSIDEDTLQLLKNARTFAFEVRGDSMIDAHIVDGDLVIMELRDPTHRDIVAPLIDGETTLKRFLVHKGKPFLRRREFQISRPYSGSRTGDPRCVSGALEGGQTPTMRSDGNDCPSRC